MSQYVFNVNTGFLHYSDKSLKICLTLEVLNRIENPNTMSLMTLLKGVEMISI